MIRIATSLGLSVTFALLCAGQASAPAPGNPRSGSDDPRIGLKADLGQKGQPDGDKRDKRQKDKRTKGTKGTKGGQKGQKGQKRTKGTA